MKNKTADRKWVVKQLKRLPKIRVNKGFVKRLLNKIIKEEAKDV